jgi:ribosomal protein uS19
MLNCWSPDKDVILCMLKMVHARARRRFQRGLKRRPMGLIKKLRKAKKEAPPNEKPAVVRTHLRDMIIVPEMIGSVVGIYNGKVCPSAGIRVRRRC